MNHDQKFAFAAVASMSLVSMINGKPTENELEEIYIQIHQSERMYDQTDFSLEALDELKAQLENNPEHAEEALLTELTRLDLEHEEATEIVNMALDVVKSNKEIPPEKIDILSGLCKALNLYSDEFNFVT
ncbi:hypothetical protein F3J37_01315 [Pantoea sp. Al-1710]|uniref:Co-chaperone DjlA N-terminal domain-containing protein n=1 Tax=Candidatus Pantoea communis TaxID=2608354 RepID=A0ABX0RI70_9GAMM|nr:hypothetical protein [Pantoea sp. Cy-640]NIG12983.1 hypothetical protein [Pantoea sp. Cy-640]NIG17316.1 hypothetical protein [Pantoea communis]